MPIVFIVLVLYCNENNQATILDALFCRPILHDAMDESVDTQLSGSVQKLFCPLCSKKHIEVDQEA